jgi:porin
VYVVPTVYVMAGLFQVNPNFRGPSGWDWFEHGTTGLSVPLEVGWTPSFGPNQLTALYDLYSFLSQIMPSFDG